MLDAYGSCVRDTRDQLLIALETWQREEDPGLTAIRAAEAGQECKARFAYEQSRLGQAAVAMVRLKELERSEAQGGGLGEDVLRGG